MTPPRSHPATNATISRSITEPVRTGLSWEETWTGEDRGLIVCWEKGRELRKAQPVLADRAARGELIPLPWKGGVEWRLAGVKKGTVFYLAMWQGLRNENLEISLVGDTHRTCTRTGQVVLFDSRHFTSAFQDTHVFQ